MPPRPSKNEQRRRIVQCAFQVLARDGLESFAMRRVAQEAGCTIGLINHWFSSKEDLVTAAWNEALERENARSADVLSTDAFSVASLLARSLPINEALRQEALVWLAFRALSLSNPTVRTACRRRFALGRRMLGDLLANGRPRSRQDEIAAATMIAAMEGITIMAALDPGRWSAQRQRQALKALLEPLLAAHRS